MRRIIAMLVLVVLTFGFAATATAQLAGSETVAKFRYDTRVLLGDTFALGFASGVVAHKNIFMWCKNPGTVGELQAFLLYGAEPHWTVWQAVAVDSERRGCEFKPMEEIRKTLGISGPRI